MILYSGFVPAGCFCISKVPTISPWESILLMEAVSFVIHLRTGTWWRLLYNSLVVSLPGVAAISRLYPEPSPIKPKTRIKIKGKASVKIIAEGLLIIDCKLAFIKERIARPLLYFAILFFTWRKGKQLSVNAFIVVSCIGKYYVSMIAVTMQQYACDYVI